ncbi:hypothetical protein BHE74_00054545 [Ensete ventricosum]|nr:hypothetical protein GW17_00007291 [Ensete ventricosum]RWW40064.1 hypothetical protein BHE74_00054545 [Ensete ventricosum]
MGCLATARGNRRHGRVLRGTLVTAAGRRRCRHRHAGLSSLDLHTHIVMRPNTRVTLMHPPLISADPAWTHGKRSGEATEDEDLQRHDPLNVPQDTIVAAHGGPPILFEDLPMHACCGRGRGVILRTPVRHPEEYEGHCPNDVGSSLSHACEGEESSTHLPSL